MLGRNCFGEINLIETFFSVNMNEFRILLHRVMANGGLFDWKRGFCWKIGVTKM